MPNPSPSAVDSTSIFLLLLFKKNLLEYSYFQASLVAEVVKNLPAMQETWVRSLGLEDPQSRAWKPTPVVLGWRIPMDRGAWWAAVHGVAKSRT